MKAPTIKKVKIYGVKKYVVKGIDGKKLYFLNKQDALRVFNANIRVLKKDN